MRISDCSSDVCSSDLGVRLLEHLGDKRILMLRNHGPVVMGRTLSEALIKYWALQRACEIQLATMSMDKPILIGDDVVNVHQRALYKAQIPGGPGKAEFDAMVRTAAKMDTSWRDNSRLFDIPIRLTQFLVNWVYLYCRPL